MAARYHQALNGFNDRQLADIGLTRAGHLAARARTGADALSSAREREFQRGRRKAALCFSTSRWHQQPGRWSLTRPMACMKA